MLTNIFGGSSSYQQSNKPAKAEKAEKPEAAEKTVALLRAQLVTDSGDADDAPPPPAKRRAVEREGGATQFEYQDSKVQ